MAIQDLTSLEIVKRISEDDVGAFEQLYSKCWAQLFSYSVNKLKSEDEAKDVVQEVFIKLWEKRKDIQIRDSVEGYLQRIAKYAILARMARDLKEDVVADHYSKYVLPDFVERFDPIQLSELQAAIDRAIDALPERLREVHRLSKQEQLSIKEIAARLDLSEQTVKNQLSNSMKRLRLSLKEALNFFLIIC